MGNGEAFGINGPGRIGKLTGWYHAARRAFPRLFVTLGREAGRGLEVVCRVRVAVHATGAFDDPARPADHPSGSLRGHLAAGAGKAIHSTAFEAKQAGAARSLP